MKTIEVSDEAYNSFINLCDFNGTDVNTTLKWLMEETYKNIPI